MFFMRVGSRGATTPAGLPRRGPRFAPGYLIAPRHVGAPASHYKGIGRTDKAVGGMDHTSKVMLLQSQEANHRMRRDTSPATDSEEKR